jgi:uncharacterized OsmC-like protein
MTDTAPAVDNGVNVDALFGARTALADSPELAEFEWRSTVNWVKGTHSTTEVETFYGLGGEQSHTKKFIFDADHPPQFAAEDHGITPAEYVLVAIGSCLTAGIASVAQARQIKLHSVRATVRAGFDLHGILGADPEVRNGFSNIKVDYEIDADASEEDIAAIVAQSQKRSAVYDALTNPTNVDVNVQKTS